MSGLARCRTYDFSIVREQQVIEKIVSNERHGKYKFSKSNLFSLKPNSEERLES